MSVHESKDNGRLFINASKVRMIKNCCCLLTNKGQFMSGSDEDEPPPLGDIPQQVDALANKLHTTDKPNRNTLEPKHKQEFGQLKKGFLCGSNPKKETKAAADEIPLLRSNGRSNDQQVPDFLRLPAVEEYAKFKNDLIARLNPTKETVDNIQKDPFLAQAFTDPEIMMAVGDVASNPSAYTKYTNNKKVVKFYEAFGKTLGQQLQADADTS